MISRLAILLAALGIVATAMGAPPAPGTASPVLRFLVQQGLKVDDVFSAPGDLTGYVGTTPQNKRIIFFVPRDGSVAIFGTMVDAHGRNLNQAFVRRFIQAPKFQKYYADLAQADWFAEGDPHPRRIVYAFVDPNCPYCWSFWRAAHKVYRKGIQVRYLMVAVLGGSSPAKAAAILGSDTPAKAFDLNEQGFRNHSGAIAPAKKISIAIKQVLANHDALMRRFGFDGTPGLVWLSESGTVKTSNGIPPPSQLAAIFGVAASHLPSSAAEAARKTR